MSSIPKTKVPCSDCGRTEKRIAVKNPVLCIGCYGRRRREKADVCSIPECEAPQENYTYELCNYHNKLRVNEAKERKCPGEMGECGRNIFRNGLCKQHSKDAIDGLGIDRVLRVSTPQPEQCQWDRACTNPPRAYGVCNGHVYYWMKENKPEALASHRASSKQNRRAREAGTYVEKIDPYVLLERDGNLCCWCLREMSWEWKYEGDNNLYRSIEHVDSLFNKGESSYANARLAHRVCNTSKNKKDRWEFLIWLTDKEEAGLLDYSSGRFRDEPLFDPEDLIPLT